MLSADLELGIDVQRTLDGRVRPLLNVDAGDIEIVSVTGGHVQLELLGACSRCILKLGCQAEMVLPVLRDRFSDRGARFSIRGVPEHLETTQRSRFAGGDPPSPRAAREPRPAAVPAGRERGGSRTMWANRGDLDIDADEGA